MVTSQSTNTAGTNRYTIPLILALIAAGLAGNYFRFPIFLNIDFLFGSIFAMLALQFFGLGRGILAATIIAGYTYILWNHPYAVIVMTLEVAAVGWLIGRRKMGLVLAELLSRRIVATLEKLRLITYDLPVRLTRGGKEIAWPESRVKEAAHLINNFRTMGNSLAEQFNEVRQINESLEQRVAERTRELRESEEKFRTVADYTYDWEVWEDPRGACLYCSPRLRTYHRLFAGSLYG